MLHVGLRRVPGFRSGRRWKQLVAAAVYLLAAVFALAGFWSPLVFVAVAAGLITDAWGLRSRISGTGRARSGLIYAGLALTGLLVLSANAPSLPHTPSPSTARSTGTASTPQPTVASLAEAPLPTPDISATVEAQVRATLTALPSATPVPLMPTATPDSRAARLAQVDDAWASGDWPSVINTLSELRKLEPTRGEYVDKLYAAYIAYGDALLAAGDKLGAGTQFGAARDLAPARTEAQERVQALTPTPVPTATPEPPKPTATSAPPKPTPTSASRMATSGQARINSGAGQAFLATTQDGLDALTKAITRGDQYGVLDLMAAGRVFMVKDGTKVLVLDHGGFLWSAVQVRVLEGQMTGRAGWLPSEWVVN